MSIYQSSYLTIDTYDNSASDVDKLGQNTDAFNVGVSDHIIIQNSIVKNQYDCLAINSSTTNEFLNSQCSGGHGISIGSIGGRSDILVQNVNISSYDVTESVNRIRIKTISGATGEVDSVTF